MADEINIVVTATDSFSAVLGNFGNIMTGIKSTVDMVVGTFKAAYEAVSPFVESAADSEFALAGLDTVLRSTADSLGSFQVTTKNLSDEDLSKLSDKLSTAKDRLEIMEAKYRALKDPTEAQTIALRQQREKVDELTASLAKGNETTTETITHSQLSRQALIDLSSALQSYTMYSDESVLSAEAMLLRFENINKDIFPDTLKLTADLAAAMKTDIVSAAQTMGKALDDPAAGIGRLNMSLKLFTQSEMDDIKTMAEHGQLAEAQALIMDKLKEKIGGTAEAYGKTFTGQIEIAKNKLDDMKEVIGGAFIPVLQQLLDTFMNFMQDSPIVKQIMGFFEEFTNLVKVDKLPLLDALGISLMGLRDLSPIFGNIAGAVFAFSGSLDAGMPFLQAFNNALLNLANGDGPLSGVAKVLSAIIPEVQKFIDTLKTEGLGAALSGLLSDVGTWIGSLNLGDKLQVLLDKLADEINKWSASGGADRLSTMLGNVISGAVKFALDGLDKTIGQVDFAPIVTALLSGLGKALWAMMQGFGDTFWSTFATTVFKDSSVDNFWASTRIGGERLLNALFPVTTIPDVIAKAKMIIQALDEGLQQGIRSIGLGGLLDFWKTILDDVKRLFGIASPSTVFYNIGRDIVQGLINGILGAIAPLTTAVESIVSVVAKPLSGVLDFLGIGSSAITGTTGGRDMTGLSPDTRSGYSLGGGLATSGSSTVNYNFYGPVYMSGVPAEGSYDCAPNPVIQSGSNQLVINGFR